jgi:hypothetical protein
MMVGAFQREEAHVAVTSSRWLVGIGVLVVFFMGLVAFLISNPPPSDKSLKKTFQTHRADFELLRSMMQEEADVVRVAKWGIETTKSVTSQSPPEGMPEARYKEYVSIMNRAGATSVYRKQNTGDIGISIWAAGWAGNTQHIDLLWTAAGPNQSPRLDQPTPSRWKARHLVDNWYILTDLK